MSSRKSENLQRKLTIAEVPTPPKDLAKRIKSEIPASFTYKKISKKSPTFMFTGMSWQFAAGLMLMLSLTIFTSYLVWSERGSGGPLTAHKVAPQPSAATYDEAGRPVATSTTPGALGKSKDDVASTEDSESDALNSNEAPQRTDSPLDQATPPPAEPSPEVVGEREELAASSRVEGGAVGGVVGGLEGRDSDRRIAMQEAPNDDFVRSAPPAPPAPPAPAAAAPAQAPVTAQAPAGPAPTFRVRGQKESQPRVKAEPIAESKRQAKAAAATDMQFRDYGSNQFVDTNQSTLATFALDVDTGSYTIARRYLKDGNLPPAAAIRPEEFVNYFTYGDRPPAKGDFNISVEGTPSPFSEGPRYRMLRVGLKARSAESTRRRPAVLTFVIDVSGSMAKGGRLETVKQALGMLIQELGSSDLVGLVVFGDRARVVIEPTHDRERLTRAINSLTPEGSTNAEEGLLVGYQMASKYFRDGGNNRIILCSDGVANVGNTEAESILTRVRRMADEGIELTTVGVGMGNYNDAFMEQLANQGNGNYAYIDGLREATRVFRDNLDGTLQTVAKDAKAQVEFNPELVSRFRLIGYENRAIADERFRDDSIDAGEVGVDHTVTALFELKLTEVVESSKPFATVRLRYRSAATRDVQELERKVFFSDMSSRWSGARPGVRLATVAARFAEVLKQAPVDPDLVAAEAEKLAESAPRDKKIQELASLTRQTAVLLGGADDDITIEEDAPDVSGPIRMGAGVRAPVVISRVEPRYTREAKENDIEGIVIIETIIDKEGRVVDTRVLKNLPYGLDSAAIEAVRKWRFRPATLNGRPVAVYFNVTVSFTQPD